jgi:hypothetical protein
MVRWGAGLIVGALAMITLALPATTTAHPSSPNATPTAGVVVLTAPPAPDPAQMATAESGGLTWSAYFLIALLCLGLLGSLAVGGLRLFRRRS